MHLFDVRYDDGPELEFLVNPEFGDADSARAEVDAYAPAIGRLPAVLLSGLDRVVIHAGDELFGGFRGRVLIHTGQGKRRIADGFLEEVLFHEAAHASLDSVHADAAEWRAAQRADGVFISDYAREHPGREDIAESFLVYLAVRHDPTHRLTAEDCWAILSAIPGRLAYFDDQGFDFSPYGTGASTCSLPPPTVADVVEGGSGY